MSLRSFDTNNDNKNLKLKYDNNGNYDMFDPRNCSEIDRVCRSRSLSSGSPQYEHTAQLITNIYMSSGYQSPQTPCCSPMTVMSSSRNGKSP